MKNDMIFKVRIKVSLSLWDAIKMRIAGSKAIDTILKRVKCNLESIKEIK